MRTRNSFQPGNTSGKGRPPGSRNRNTLKYEQMLEKEGEGIIRKLIKLANKGDPMALKLCVERLISTRKERPMTLELPKIRTTGSLHDALNEVLQATVQGRITSEQGANLTRTLDIGRRWIETEDLDRQLQEMKIAIQEMKNNERRAT
jgi:hypothetical protein